MSSTPRQLSNVIEQVRDPAPEFLRFEHVGKTYESSKRGPVLAVQDLSFSVRQGTFVSILGPSGCGKSTLLKMAAGVTSITTGAIYLQGQAVRGPNENLGMVFQTPVLLEWRDVLSNVMLPIEILGLDRQQGRARAERLLKTAGLGGFEHHNPSELSGGMQQRVAICRALAFDPPLLLMDEPFGALDALTRDEMGMELLRIWDETRKTIVFVTHSIDEAVLLSDKVIVMSARPGRLNMVVDIELDRPREMRTRYQPKFGDYSQEIRAAIVASQAS